MAIGAVIFGTLLGIAAALVLVVGLGLPLWLGFLAWWAIGTAMTIGTLAAIAFEPREQALPDGLLDI